VPEHPPELPDTLWDLNFNFRDFLLTKVVNGLLASLQSPQLANKLWTKPKEAFLVDIVKTASKNKSVITSLDAPAFS